MAVGDFNGDHKLDLVTPNYFGNGVSPGDLSILLGNGDGTFQSAVFYEAGNGPNYIAVADYDHDGKLDLAVANSFASNVSLLLGNGDGSFQSHIDYRVPEAPWHIAAADFDGDGNLDLATTNFGDGFAHGQRSTGAKGW